MQGLTLAFRTGPLGAPSKRSGLADRLDPGERLRSKRACADRNDVNGDGTRDIVGLDVAIYGHGADWLAFLCGLADRGLPPSSLSTSDCTTGCAMRSRPCCKAHPGSSVRHAYNLEVSHVIR
jgi:Transposase, Mutator family